MPTLSSFLPILTGLGGIGFLGAGVALGVRRSLTKVHAEEMAEKKRSMQPVGPDLGPPRWTALAAQELPGGVKLGNYAARALLYGTALCLAGGAASMLLVGWALGVRDAQGFTDKMKELMPNVKDKLIGSMGPTLQSVAGGGRTIAKMADGTLGSVARSTVPALAGPSLQEDELKGLSKKDKAAVKELLKWLEGEEGGGTASSPPPEKAQR